MIRPFLDLSSGHLSPDSQAWLDAQLADAVLRAPERPEVTNWPPGTHKPRNGLSENLSVGVSAYSTNLTVFSVVARPVFVSPIRSRSGVYGKQVFPDSPTVRDPERPQGIFG